MFNFLENELFQKDWFFYAGILAFAVPFLVIVFNELIYRFDKKHKRLSSPISLIRNIVLPLVAVTVVFTQVIGYSRDTNFVKIIETIIWILVINALIAIINILFFAGGEKSLIKAKVPQLFLDIFRVFMVLLGGAIVLSVVWGADLGGLVTALGLGSFVLGLALQDTLGNLFSGIALLYEKPFTEGDVIKVNDDIGTVTEMNWRAIRMLTRENEMVIIPHLVIGQGVIINYSRPSKAHVMKTNLGFAYHIPPNKVKEAIMKTCLSTPGILHDPPPEVKTQEFADYQIIYEVEFAIWGYMTFEEIMDDFMTRVWYTARRHELTIPFPQLDIHQKPVQNQSIFNKSDRLKAYLQRLPTMLPIDKNRVEELAEGTDILHFGKGEYIVKQGDTTGTLYIIMSGMARLSVQGKEDNQLTINDLHNGDFFGEITLFTEKISSFSVLAISDLELLAISPSEVMKMVERNPKLAHYLDNMMDARRKRAQEVLEGS